MIQIDLNTQAWALGISDTFLTGHYVLGGKMLPQH